MGDAEEPDGIPFHYFAEEQSEENTHTHTHTNQKKPNRNANNAGGEQDTKQTVTLIACMCNLTTPCVVFGKYIET